MSNGQVIVVGGGAAGLLGSIFAARGGAKVVLLESTSDGGRKILISGGGRCNVLPSEIDPSRYITDSSRNTLKKLLRAWPLDEQKAFFEKDLRIPLALEDETGKLFPASNKARDIRDGLTRHAAELGVEIRFGSPVREIRRSADGDWVARTGAGTHTGRCLVMATGGLSVPQTGSDGWGLEALGQLGHSLNPTYPALTPLTANPPVHAALAGVSLRVGLSAPPPGGPLSFDGGFLFTHRGYSGPSVLNLSHVAVRAENAEAQPIFVRWGDLDEEGWRGLLTEGGAGRVLSVIRQHLPTRLAERLVAESGVDGDRPLAQLRREERSRLITMLTSYPLPWSGDEGYKKAEVTGGGVALGAVHADTLESRISPGLFICGEMLDAFGPIGGYNFAWAWATGRTAGKSAAAVACGP